MDTTFPQWQLANELNREIGISPSECEYLLLLVRTKEFKVIADIKQTLRITRQPLVWFVRKFQKHKVRVEYVTVFTQKEIEKLGPIATTVSQGIVKKLLGRHYANQPICVCHNQFFKEIQPGQTYQAISPQTLTQLLLE